MNSIHGNKVTTTLLILMISWQANTPHLGLHNIGQPLWLLRSKKLLHTRGEGCHRIWACVSHGQGYTLSTPSRHPILLAMWARSRNSNKSWASCATDRILSLHGCTQWISGDIHGRHSNIRDNILCDHAFNIRVVLLSFSAVLTIDILSPNNWEHSYEGKHKIVVVRVDVWLFYVYILALLSISSKRSYPIHY